MQRLNQVDIVLFYGWNEYAERTEIEPHYDHNNIESLHAYESAKECVAKLHDRYTSISGVGIPLWLIFASIFTVIIGLIYFIKKLNPISLLSISVVM